ncbi:MAG TPA: hypothetical protein VMQ17_28545 [Candidatus Sulfotelmatobacter sp.]|nr:hypothetical protein [Candidatus Sulfotelmatobacter sp.]
MRFYTATSKKNNMTRKGFRKDLQKLRDVFDKMVYEKMLGYRKQLSGMVNKSGAKLKE